MFDLKWIRENADAFDSGLAKRGIEPLSPEILKIDDERRAHLTALQDAQTKRNAASKEIGKAKASGDEAAAAAAIADVAKIKEFIQKGEELEREIDERLKALLSGIPNLPHDDVPMGDDETDNEVVRIVGDVPDFDFAPKEHFEIGEVLGLMDFEVAARMSGSRFVVLSGALARLERAITQFMLDLQTGEHGYTEVSPPMLVKDVALYGTGQLPKFEEDLFKTTSEHYLIPTAEVPLTNIVAGAVIEEDYLPRRYTAFTPCFRSEAGSAGRDTRGMIRQHQFMKVELVSVTSPEQSGEELERMTGCAEEVLKRLNIAYRVVKLCTGDMGFGARRTYDIEVWLPGQNSYREISSCSVCGDFQARRMNARYRAEGEKALKFVHTLNGSGLAVGRTLVAILENYQQGDGSVVVPEVLKPYMGGVEVISATS